MVLSTLCVTRKAGLMKDKEDFPSPFVGENHPAPVETVLSRQGIFIADVCFIRFLIDDFQYQFVRSAFFELILQMITCVDQFTVQIPLTVKSSSTFPMSVEKLMGASISKRSPTINV